MDFHCNRIQKAKRQYRCRATGAIIKPGDKYYYLCGNCEGDFYHVRMHHAVYPIYEKLNAYHWNNEEEGLYFDEVLTVLSEDRTRYYPNKNFLRNLVYSRKIAKLDGVPEWFVKKITQESK